MSVQVRLAMAILALGCLSAPAAAQSAAAGNRMAVIDIGHIFDNHPSYKARIAGIDEEMKRAEEQINARREGLLKEIEVLRNLVENSADYKAKEEEIAKEESRLKLEFGRREKGFAEQKAQVVYDIYNQLQQVVSAFAEHNGIDLVIRYSRKQKEMDPKRPQSVIEGINREVVFHRATIDMTDSVLDYIKQQSAGQAAPQSAQGGAAQPRR